MVLRVFAGIVKIAASVWAQDQKAGVLCAGGRRLRFEKETPLCNSYLSMLHRMGIEEKSFGDSTGTLAGLG